MKARFALLATVVAILAGCGGSTSVLPGGGTTENPYAGTYRSTMNLDNGKQGDLNLTVSASGDASGTLVVEGPNTSPSRDGFSFTAGTLTVTGEANPNGTFSLQGSDPTSGPFSVSGSLPANGNGNGSVEIKAGGQTFTGSITVGMGTGTGSITFSAINGAPILGTAFPSNPYVLISTVNGFTGLTVIPSLSDTSRSLGFTLTPEIATGDVIDLPTATDNVLVAYSEGTTDPKVWRASGGKLTIVSRTASSIELKLTDVEFTGHGSDAGAGTFKINGTIKK